MAALLRSAQAIEDGLRQPIEEFLERLSDFIGLTTVLFGHREILLLKEQKSPARLAVRGVGTDL